MPATHFIDSTHSSLDFAIAHLVISRYRGSFRKVEGVVVLDDQTPSACSIDAKVEVASIDAADPGLRAAVLGDDFFRANQHPYVTFKSTSVSLQGPKQWLAEGTLTIRGIAKPVTLRIDETGGRMNPFLKKHVRAFSATTTISRNDFDMKWNVPMDAGEWYLGDEVSLSLMIECPRNG